MTRRQPWSLRRRLIAGILALIVVLGIAIGAVSTAVLQTSLIDRLDRQLDSSVGRSGAALGRPGGLGDHENAPPVGGFVLGEAAGAIGALVIDGEFVQAGYLTETGDEQSLSDAQIIELVSLPVDGEPYTVDLGADLGRYRVVAEPLNSTTTVIVGLSLGDVDDTVTQLAITIAFVTALALGAAAALGAVVVRIALRPLDRVVATATRVSELPLDEGEVQLAERVPESATAPGTEVGRVGAALNRLLGRVESALSARQASEDKLRRFVADASHELRTPLASIRGYSEFVRTKGQDLDPDFARSLERIDSESQRMTSLVEDMLLLARLDAGPVMHSDPVDLSRLLIDAVSDAHAAGPGHVWQLELPDEPVTVPGDAPRLHQVLANLLANARIHTPEGTRVDVSVEQAEQVARIRIADDGPGIPASIQPTLFERFVRGDDSRARSRLKSAPGGSTGLGLAIVKAIVESHGGAVRVTSTPGSTQFVIELPTSAEPDAAAGTSSS